MFTRLFTLLIISYIFECVSFSFLLLVVLFYSVLLFYSFLFFCFDFCSHFFCFVLFWSFGGSFSCRRFECLSVCFYCFSFSIFFGKGVFFILSTLGYTILFCFSITVASSYCLPPFLFILDLHSHFFLFSIYIQGKNSRAK